MDNTREQTANSHETFILYSPDVPVISGREFEFEGDAQQTAEVIARHNPGARVSIAKVIASVINPLPALEWTDGRSAGPGVSHGGRLVQSSPQRLQSPEEQYSAKMAANKLPEGFNYGQATRQAARQR